MELIQPEIRLEWEYVGEYSKLFRNYCDIYNFSKSSKEYLRGNHLSLLINIFRCIPTTIEWYDNILLSINKNLFVRDNKFWCKVNLNRHHLASRIHVHSDTIKRQIKRLLDAGIVISSDEIFKDLNIEKTHYNDVLINPDFLLLYDTLNPEYLPESPYFKRNTNS